MYVRVRPLNDAERERGTAWRVEGNGLFQVDPASEARVSDTSYKLDAVFDGSQPTADVYASTTQELIHQVVNGFNSTVFAYGQVGSPSGSSVWLVRGSRQSRGLKDCKVEGEPRRFLQGRQFYCTAAPPITTCMHRWLSRLPSALRQRCPLIAVSLALPCI